MFGMSGTFAYNVSLCIYYFCAIAIGMEEKKIKRRIEPFLLHGTPMLAGVISALPALFNDMYNPTIDIFAWCAPHPYPYECIFRDDVECIRGLKEGTTYHYRLRINVSIALSLFVTLVCLSSVLIKVRRIEGSLEKASKLYRSHPAYQRMIHKHHDSKVVFVQSLIYFGSCLTCQLPLFLGFNCVLLNIANEVRLDKAILVLFPLQGFFNFMIFMSHKILLLKQLDGNENISIFRSVLILLRDKLPMEPCYISRIVIVDMRRAGHLEENDDVESSSIGDNYSYFEWNAEDEDGAQEKITVHQDGNENEDSNEPCQAPQRIDGINSDHVNVNHIQQSLPEAMSNGISSMVSYPSSQSSGNQSDLSGTAKSSGMQWYDRSFMNYMEN